MFSVLFRYDPISVKRRLIVFGPTPYPFSAGLTVFRATPNTFSARLIVFGPSLHEIAARLTVSRRPLERRIRDVMEIDCFSTPKKKLEWRIDCFTTCSDHFSEGLFVLKNHIYNKRFRVDRVDCFRAATPTSNLLGWLCSSCLPKNRIYGVDCFRAATPKSTLPSS